MLDLDRFKQINDAFGHSMGDRVLKALARLVQLRLRASDFVGRVGGEEFMLIMPETGVDAAHAVVDELRAQFGRQPHQLASRTLFASFSAGVAGARGPLSGAALARAADRALYRAKRGGRDRALTATEAEFAD
jgi:diguanylate cyclase (GGDEF)-like protein